MYRLSQDVIVKQRGGIYFGLNMKTGTTYEMNESQFDIVSFFKNDYHSKDELLTYLTSIYDVTSKEIEAEVDFTLNESVSVGLLIEKIANCIFYTSRSDFQSFDVFIIRNR